MSIRKFFSCIMLGLIPLVAVAGGKKGIGLSSGYGVTQLQALQVSWYYNWEAHSALKTKEQFVPMAHSAKHIAAIEGRPEFVLGFNEPDNPKQSAYMDVNEALSVWPQLLAKGGLVGSPSMAKNPVNPDGWLHSFMAKARRVDFVTVHWYRGADSEKFISDMKEIHAAYGKPIWVTEFAPQTAAESREKPNRYTQQQVMQFMQQTVRWMNGSDFVQRYAWHDPKIGTSALFVNGVLTATGRAYAALE